MKYLVNRETKEHVVYHDSYTSSANHFVVEADADGWVKWDGGECPLPGSAMCEIKTLGNPDGLPAHTARLWAWGQTFTSSTRLTHYRPVLDKPEETRPTARVYLDAADDILRNKRDQLYTAEGVRAAIEEAAATEGRLPTLLERLKAAHEAAQRIPDLEAELREVLGAMGYDLVARSPFVDLTQQEPPEDMSDWRNWKPGDLVTWKPGAITYPWWTPGKLYEVTLRNGELVVIADDGGFYNISDKRLSNGSRFRFYSRQKVKS